jgi:CBS domain-containing protein
MGTDDRDLDEAAEAAGEGAEEAVGEAGEVAAGEPAGEAAADPTVGDVMERDVISVHPETGVQELAELMHERRIGGAPVVDGAGRLVGIVTDGDLTAEEADINAPAQIDIFGAIVYLGSFHKYEEKLRKAVGATVGDVMTRKVHVVHPDDSVRKAATLMRDHKINRVPVVEEDGKLVGLVTRTDIVHSLGL